MESRNGRVGLGVDIDDVVSTGKSKDVREYKVANFTGNVEKQASWVTFFDDFHFFFSDLVFCFNSRNSLVSYVFPVFHEEIKDSPCWNLVR